MHLAQEMMYGSREKFQYLECSRCGSLQLSEVPPDMSSYYPSNYYSLASITTPENETSWVRLMLRRQLSSYMTGRKNFLGWIISHFSKDWFGYSWDWFRDTGVSPTDDIIDIGCGRGDLLQALRTRGFTSLHGVDPFVPKRVRAPGFQISRCSIFEVHDRFDLVMSHHSLEHVSDPFLHLQKMRELCKEDGYLLIRIPILGASWEKYGTCWYELDPPRHIWIPTIKGLKLLLDRVGGLNLEKITCDGGSFEIYRSELYQRGIPQYDESGQLLQIPEKYFTQEKLANIQHQMDIYNSTGVAGRAVFIIRRSLSP